MDATSTTRLSGPRSRAAIRFSACARQCSSSPAENYRIREVAEIVGDVVPGSEVAFADGASPDIRNYRVDCDKIERVLPAYRPQWTVRRAVEELYEAYLRHGLQLDDFLSRRFMRIRHVRELQAEGVLDERLRRQEVPVV